MIVTFDGDMLPQGKYPPTADERVAFEQLKSEAKASVQRLLDKAQSKLKLPDILAITITNRFHTSTDPNEHCNFHFTMADGPCAAGCTGHSYKEGSNHQGMIFKDSDKKTIWCPAANTVSTQCYVK
jgi:hypothetical protein